MSAWHDEYLRRVAVDQFPDHADHGLRITPKVSGYDPSGCDTCGNDGSMDAYGSGVCPCGASIYFDVRGEEDFAAFFRRITEDET
jgi:hypothetical protein